MEGSELMSMRLLVNAGLVTFCGVALTVMGLWGCRKADDPSPGLQTSTAPAEGDNSSAKAPPPKPLLEGWTKPAVALLLSGEQHGYLEPCGCTENQSGGLSRRFDLFRQLEEKGWPLAAVDLGGTLKRSRRQSRIKFETLLTALKDLGYDALAFGPEELRLGAENLLALHLPEELPFVGSNIIFFGSPELGTPITHRVVEVEGTKIGITAVLGQSYADEVLPRSSSETDPPIQVTDPAEALPKALEALEAEKPDLIVLLSHAKLSESKALAEKFPQIDLILSAGGPEDPDSKPEMIGKTMLVTVGGKGKYTGVVGYYPGSEPPLRYELVNLDNIRFQDSPRMRAHMKFYQERLRDERIAETEAAIQHPSGAGFVGAAKCGECHTKAYNKWRSTKHAQAFESLKVGRKGQEADWIERTHDAECLACHVTGWHPQEALRFTTGYESESKSPHLLGQQCENCHGPGSRHVEEEELWKKNRGPLGAELVKWRKAVHLDPQMAKDRVCYQCHDLDNSPNFEFDKYWKEVVHPWRD